MTLREVFATEAGLITATTLHTLGAIGVVAALATHIAWTLKLRRGIHSEALHKATFWIAVNAVAANLVGGFMRTWLPAHPGLADLGTSPWVQVMVLKHLFVFSSLGAILYLHHYVAPRLARAAEAKRLGRRTPTAQALGVVVVIAGVVGASVLGALAQISPLYAAPAANGHDDHDMHDPFGRPHEYVNATGTLTSTFLAPAADTGTFPVRGDTVQLQAMLVWQPTQYTLQAVLTDPDGTAHPMEPSPNGGLRADLPPIPGPWQYRITSDLAILASWELSVRMSAPGPQETFLVETVTVPRRTFFEINTVMEEGATFWWDWTTTAVVHFDVHSHFDGQTQYHEELEADTHRGNFTNDREGIYSLLWANEGNGPVTLTYRVWGQFDVHSYFPPRP